MGKTFMLLFYLFWTGVVKVTKFKEFTTCFEDESSRKAYLKEFWKRAWSGFQKPT
jgi:Ni,Fe-hydrogenase I cytochrome b subunit